MLDEEKVILMTKMAAFIDREGKKNDGAVKVSEEPNIEVLRETYATQHGIGFVLWMEIDNVVEDTQKIVKGTVVAAG